MKENNNKKKKINKLNKKKIKQLNKLIKKKNLFKEIDRKEKK
jgi:hypothetical protein